MTYPMNLRKIGRYYRIWFSRGEMPPSGRLVSMREIVGYSVTDKNEAQDIYSTVKKNWHKGKIIELEQGKRVPLDIFAKEYLASRKDKSPDTLRADSLALRSLGDVLGSKVSLQVISAKQIDRFRSASLARGLKPTSLNSYLRHIRAALYKAKKWKYIKDVPEIELAEEPKRIPRILSKKESDKILNYAKKHDFEAWRIIQFALWTGCRRTEIHGALWQNVNTDEIRIVGKGNEERIIPLLPKSLEAMGEPKDIGSIFEQTHADNYWKRYKVIVRAVGIIDVTFHDLRKSAITRMIESGMAPNMVQKWMGHKDFKTTEIYIKIADDALKKEAKKYEKWGS